MTDPAPRRRPPADSAESAGGRAAPPPTDTADDGPAPQPVDGSDTDSTRPQGEQPAVPTPAPAPGPATVPVVSGAAASAARTVPMAVSADSRAHSRHSRPRRWPRRVAAAALGAGLVVLGGGSALALWGHPAAPAPISVGTIPAANAGGRTLGPAPASGSMTPPALPAATASTSPTDPGASASAAPLVVMPPIHLQIPAIKVDTSLTPLGLQDDGTIAVPSNFAQAGWYDGGTMPGDPGPAVVLGHIDSYRGPAVFYRLRQLRPGDVVAIQRLDSTTVRFAVDALREFPKDQFPTDLVYGDTATPTLRLITCGGAFDTKTRNYLDNVVVFAHEFSDDRVPPVPTSTPSSAPPTPPASPAGTGPAPGGTP